MLGEYLGAGQQHESHQLQSQHPRHLFDRWTAGKGDAMNFHWSMFLRLFGPSHAPLVETGIKIIFQLRSCFFHRMRGQVPFLRELRLRCLGFDARSSIFPRAFLFFDINRIETIHKRAKMFWHHVHASYAFRSLKLTFIDPWNSRCTLFFFTLISVRCVLQVIWLNEHFFRLRNEISRKFHESIYIYDGGIIRNKITSSR